MTKKIAAPNPLTDCTCNQGNIGRWYDHDLACAYYRHMAAIVSNDNPRKQLRIKRNKPRGRVPWDQENT